MAILELNIISHQNKSFTPIMHTKSFLTIPYKKKNVKISKRTTPSRETIHIKKLFLIYSRLAIYTGFTATPLCLRRKKNLRNMEFMMQCSRDWFFHNKTHETVFRRRSSYAITQVFRPARRAHRICGNFSRKPQMQPNHLLLRCPRAVPFAIFDRFSYRNMTVFNCYGPKTARD